MVAGTVMTGLFLANRVARREGGAWGLTGEETGGEEIRAEGGWRVLAAGGTVQFLCSSSFIFSFLVMMVMDWRVVRWTMGGRCLAALGTEEWINKRNEQMK